MCCRASVDRWGRGVTLSLMPCGGVRLLLGDHAGGNDVRLVLELRIMELGETLGFGNLNGLSGGSSSLGVSDLNGLGSGGCSLGLGGGLEGNELLSFRSLSCLFRPQGSMGLGDAFRVSSRGDPRGLDRLHGPGFGRLVLLLLRGGGPLFGFPNLTVAGVGLKSGHLEVIGPLFSLSPVFVPASED